MSLNKPYRRRILHPKSLGELDFLFVDPKLGVYIVLFSILMLAALRKCEVSINGVEDTIEEVHVEEK